MSGWRFENYLTEQGDESAYKAATDFAANPAYWLTLWGGYGRGKSHLLAAIHHTLTARGLACYYVTMPDLTSQLRQAVGNKDVEGFYSRISHYPVLLIDEVDKADLRQWTREQAFRLFNRRANLKGDVGTVMAMNVNPDPAADDLGYLFSRMHDGQNVCIKVGGPDNRGNVPLLRQLAGALRVTR